MATVPLSELHARLRLATKALHHLLDHHPVVAPLVRDDLTLEHYGDALAALHGIYAPLEAGIDDFLKTTPGLFDYHPRRKLPALQDDLARLGRRPGSRQLDYSAPTTIPELVSVLYTVEGTTLGGQHILRCLRQRAFDNLPMRFFNGYGEQTAARWSEFLAFADRVCPPADHRLAEEAAVALFQGVKTYLDG
ncbi:MAG TPA: biliverdin-producing heme oxygenase [Rhodospirillaceae bacterium]|nr:biliverdin-producing heme oxygenase [Rhodospirillaceae bacterium]